MVRSTWHWQEGNEAESIFEIERNNETIHLKKTSKLKFAVCIHNAEYPASLELHKIYRVLPDREAAEDGDLRIIDESGEDFLYRAEWPEFIELPKVIEESLQNVA